MSGFPNPLPGPLDKGPGGNNLDTSLEDLALEIKLLLAEAVLILNKDENNEQRRALATEWLTEIGTTKPDSELARRAQERLEDIKSDHLQL
jgi:hypothetical protein